MQNHSGKNERIDELLDEIAAGELGLDQQRELIDLLSDDPDAQEQFVENLTTHAWLQWQVSPVGHALHDETTRGDTVDPGRTASPTARPKSLLNWASRHPKGPAVAIAATVLITALVVMGLVPVKQWVAGEKAKTEESGPAAKKEFVARLSNWRNDAWLEETRPPLDDPRLKVGRRLKIESGLIEVTYLTGARVVIEGPAEFIVGRWKGEGEARELPGRHLESDDSTFVLPSAHNSGYLALGKLSATVQGEKAQGFAIVTPMGRVEDLGTEFGVEVMHGGATEVAVLSGEVDLVRESAPGIAAERIRLATNQGAYIAGGTDEIRRRKTVEAELILSMRKRLESRFDKSSLGVAGRGNVIVAPVTELTWNDGTSNVRSTIASRRNIVSDSTLVAFRVGATEYTQHVGSNRNDLAGTPFYGDDASASASALAALSDDRLDTGAANIADGSNFFLPSAPTNLNAVLLVVESGADQHPTFQLFDESNTLIGNAVSTRNSDWLTPVATHEANTVPDTSNVNAIAIPLGKFVSADQLNAVAGVRITVSDGIDPMYIGISNTSEILRSESQEQ